MKLCELIIQGQMDRRTLAGILADNGYNVRIEERTDSRNDLHHDHILIIEDKEPEINISDINISADIDIAKINNMKLNHLMSSDLHPTSSDYNIRSSETGRMQQ